IHAAVFSYQETAQMAAINVAQSPRRLVVIGKQKRGVGTVASVVIEQAVHRPEQHFGLIEGQRRLAPQAGLQIRHQQSGGDPLAGNIADDQPQPLWPEIQEIEIIPSNLARLQADTRVLYRFQLRLNLRKQPRLHLPRYFEFLGGAAFGFEFLGVRLPAQLQALPHLIEAFQANRISVRILETRIGAAPPRRLRSSYKTNPPFAPFFVLGVNIFGHEQDPAVAANQLVFRRVGLWFHQRKIRAAVGRRHFDPAFAGGKALFGEEFEAQLLQVEPLTHFQIANENDYVLDRQIGLFAARAKHGPVRPREKSVAGHRRDYNWPDKCCNRIIKGRPVWSRL